MDFGWDPIIYDGSKIPSKHLTEVVFHILSLHAFISVCSDQSHKFTERPRPGVQTVCSSFSPGTLAHIRSH